MNTRSNVSVLFDVGDINAPKGSLAWIKAVHELAKAALNDASTVREHVEARIAALREGNRYQQLIDASGRPFMFWETFCTTRQPHGLGYSSDAIDAIIAERKSLTVQQRAEEPRPLAEHRRPTNEERASKGDSITFTKGRGTDPDYLTARIARDRPDILERMQAGEYASTRAAALDAGIVKRRVSVEATSFGFARAAQRTLNESERVHLVMLLTEGAPASIQTGRSTLSTMG